MDLRDLQTLQSFTSDPLPTLFSTEAGVIDEVLVTYYGIDDGYGVQCPQRCVTASGERFHPYGLTAATNLFPLGTRLRVCYGGACVEVRVNDTCGSCSLDLSYGAFAWLAPHRQGVLWGTIEVIP